MCSIKKNLLYITSDYPNSRGDTAFIETEIKYIAKQFNHVIVMSHGNKDESCVSFPKNVTVLYFTKDSRIKRYLSYCKVLFSCVFLKEFSLIIKTKKKKKLSCCKMALSFLGAADSERKQIERVIKKYDIDTCYTFWYWNSALACLLALKHMGLSSFKPMCTRTHGFDLYELRNAQHYQPFKIKMDKNISKVFFISRQGMDYYLKTFAAEQNINKYELFYLGTENQTEFKIHNSGKTIELISISYIVPVKRIHLIIKALAECATHNIKINWTHIGDGSEKQNILALAESLLNDSTVSYNFLGHLENKSIHEHLRNHGYDLFVNMSESEGLPVSMMEAMSYGIPVIGTNVGGVGEIVDSNTGYLLDKDDCCNQFLDVILKWRKMTEPQKQTKRVNAYNKWNVFFNAEKNYTEFAKDLLNTDKKQEKGKEI